MHVCSIRLPCDIGTNGSCGGTVMGRGASAQQKMFTSTRTSTRTTSTLSFLLSLSLLAPVLLLYLSLPSMVQRMSGLGYLYVQMVFVKRAGALCSFVLEINATAQQY